MSNKVLIISPTPTHPTRAGNRSRILSNAKLFRSYGYDVHFLLAPQEPYDENELQQFWGEKLFVYTSSNKPTISTLSLKVKKKIQILLGNKLGISKFIYNKNIDDYYPSGLDNYLDEHLKEHVYAIVLVEYVVYSKAFLHFGKSVLKIVDTHDKFSNRYLTYLRSGLKPEWYSLYPFDERIGLKRADIVLAIQKKEAVYFKNLCSRKVIVLGHVVDYNCSRNANNKNLLFVASDNIINVQAIETFFNSIFIDLIKELPNVKLLLAGSICSSKTLKIPFEVQSNVVMIGSFNDAKEVYGLASVAINPVQTGTGLKIKIIEALAYGLPVVSFVKSNESLISLNIKKGNKILRLVESDSEFIKAVKESFDIPQMYSNHETEEFIHQYNQLSTNELFEVLKPYV